MATSLARSRAHAPEDLRGPAAALSASELAWIVAVPCAVLTALAVAVLGPPLGHAMFAPHGEGLWPRDAPYVVGSPEPVKHARFALALLGALLLPALVLLGARRPPALPRRATVALVTCAQVLLCAALGLAVVAQRGATYVTEPRHWRVFSAPTLVVGCLLAVALAAILRSTRAASLGARLADGRRGVGAACLAVAALVAAVWLLPAVATEHTAANGPFPDLPPWSMSDTYAVLGGRTPLVNFHAVYGQLWAYVAALSMRLLGDTMGAFTITMATISGVALLAAYGTLRRVVRSAPLALGLYVPFVATSFYEVGAPLLSWSVSNGEIYSVWPMRYAGPLFLAWLTARHLDGARPRSAWVLGLASGLVAVNNVEFGLGAVGGTLLALACVPARWSRRELARLAGGLAAGVLGAIALVASLTLARAGSLPRFGLLLEYPHVFGALGLVSAPMPALGIHLALYATYAAVLAAAAMRVARRATDVLLTGLLAWSGVFGLASASYFAGRSDAIKLAALFPAWAFALALLTVVVARGLVRRTWRVPAPAELAVLAGWGLMACAVVQVHAPWAEIARLQRGGAPAIFQRPALRAFVQRFAAPGDRVALLVPMGGRIAYDAGLVDVAPYGDVEMMATRAQMHTLVNAMRAAHAHKLFLPDPLMTPAQLALLRRAGFRLRVELGGVSYWSDARAP